jgi:hypothetical protein
LGSKQNIFKSRKAARLSNSNFDDCLLPFLFGASDPSVVGGSSSISDSPSSTTAFLAISAGGRHADLDSCLRCFLVLEIPLYS